MKTNIRKYMKLFTYKWRDTLRVLTPMVPEAPQMRCGGSKWDFPYQSGTTFKKIF
ncbi:hypothetical protein SK128_022032 [Halocaridina rubra]|uniref:Uncharacterized protein n=1 Tax=Halocaridina rubra TaxID=373956 RepID=A0AAN8X485_HALRR